MRAILSIAIAACLTIARLSPAGAQPAHPTPPDAHPPQAQGTPLPHAMVSKAIAILVPTAGSQVAGTVTFEQTPGGVKLIADISGLSPGRHGFHIHEFGDLSAPDFASAGPHYMGAGEAHGAPGDTGSHRGDLGNLVADAAGKAHLEWVGAHMMLGGPAGILGRSIVVHEQEDDLSSQPTGNSGARIACGVIGIAKP